MAMKKSALLLSAAILTILTIVPPLVQQMTGTPGSRDDKRR
jgi:hypothetical protein